jgi:hypothetical protein
VKIGVQIAEKSIHGDVKFQVVFVHADPDTRADFSNFANASVEPAAEPFECARRRLPLGRAASPASGELFDVSVRCVHENNIGPNASADKIEIVAVDG